MLYNKETIKRGGVAMNCMKCGREIEESQVFCPDCLADMEKYPVKPGTVVQLPRTSAYQPVKKPPQRRKAAPPLEEQVRTLRKWARMLALALVLAIILLVGVGYVAVRQYLEMENRVLPGQNYSSEVTPTTSTSDQTRR